MSQTGLEFPQAALSTLIKLATSHAKLSLRLEVTMDDAVFACYFYEELVSSRSGYSYLGIVPTPSIVEGSLSKVLGRENDLKMRAFHLKLEGFVREYCEEEGLREFHKEPVVVGVGQNWNGVWEGPVGENLRSRRIEGDNLSGGFGKDRQVVGPDHGTNSEE